MKTLSILGALAAALFFSASAGAQALPTATAAGGLQIGIGYSYDKPDYGPNAWQGFTAFGDYDLSPHVGVEGDIHYIDIITPVDLAQNSYLIGPRFIYPHGRLKFYAKGLVGMGDMVAQETQDNQGAYIGSFFAYSLGGGVDYIANHHIVIRAIDMEYQHWSYLNGLTPTVFTAGIGYRFR